MKSNKLQVPDVEAAEDSKENSSDDGDGHGQQRGDDAVEPDPGHLEERVTPDPHPISTPHRLRLRLRYHVLKTHLTNTDHLHIKQAALPAAGIAVTLQCYNVL